MAYWAVVVQPDDEVAIVVDGKVVRIRPDGTVDHLDRPAPALEPGVHELDEAAFAALTRPAAADPDRPGDRRDWLVSLDLPIEANSPAEAVRAFWRYANQLGPRELPTFVAPVGDELAMQAYVLGEPVNLDPEED